eukprot:TRINITY_DN3526_c0_g1_i8.p1 TRINITY_DN3526_c0_g1~~TRINITY_DN3526_c0_g1_i8.p1  ORF type:complete len:320 (-),score=39.31 TRINITY_DN3526_c0_g1_i8:268-1227(-)
MCIRDRVCLVGCAVGQTMEADLVAEEEAHSQGFGLLDRTLGAGIVVAGCILGLLGYRLYKFNLFLVSFMLCGVGVYHLIRHQPQVADHEYLRLVICALCGTIFGIGTSNVYPVGVLLMGIGWGVSGALILNGAVISRIANVTPVLGHEMESNMLLWMSLLTAGALLGVLSLVCQWLATEPNWKQHAIILLQTCTPGAYLVTQGVRLVANLTEIPAETEMARVSTMPDEYYLVFGGTSLLMAFFMMIQHVSTHKENCWSTESSETTTQPIVFYYDTSNNRREMEDANASQRLLGIHEDKQYDLYQNYQICANSGYTGPVL